MKEPERDGAPENTILPELSEPQKPGRLEGPARARATFVRPPGDRSMPRFENSPVPPLVGLTRRRRILRARLPGI